jgi:hypothetical protein
VRLREWQSCATSEVTNCDGDWAGDFCPLRRAIVVGPRARRPPPTPKKKRKWKIDDSPIEQRIHHLRRVPFRTSCTGELKCRSVNYRLCFLLGWKITQVWRKVPQTAQLVGKVRVFRSTLRHLRWRFWSFSSRVKDTFWPG